MQDKNISESRSATHARGWPICNHILYSWDSSKLFAPGSFQHRLHARIWTNFLRSSMEWESRHPLVFMCRRYLNCAVYDSSGLLMQSMSPRPHRSMWQRLSCQRGILVVNRDHKKVWGGLRVTGGMPSREVVKSSFLLSLSLSPCRRRVTVYSLRHKRAIMMIHHWPGTRANQMS